MRKMVKLSEITSRQITQRKLQTFHQTEINKQTIVKRSDYSITKIKKICQSEAFQWTGTLVSYAQICGNSGVEFWNFTLSFRILVTEFLTSDFWDVWTRILRLDVLEFWPQNFGPKNLASKLRPQKSGLKNLGLEIQKLWP